MVAVPAFLYLFDFSPIAATTASLAVVAASATSGAIPRLRMGQVAVRQALTFWLLGVAGTFAGSRLAPHIPEVLIVGGFALVMIGAAVAMWRKSSATEAEAAPKRSPWLLPVVAIAVGLLTGIFGVGGGFLIVPALVLVFGLPFGLATGTSLVVVALNSITALLFKADAWSQIHWAIPSLVIVGGLVGSFLASRFNVGIPRRYLERGFAVLLVILAAWMVAEALLLRS